MSDTESTGATLEETVAALSDAVADLAARVAVLEVNAAATEGGEPQSDDPAFKALAKKYGNLSREFAALNAKLSAPRAGTVSGTNTGPAAGKKYL